MKNIHDCFPCCCQIFTVHIALIPATFSKWTTTYIWSDLTKFLKKNLKENNSILYIVKTGLQVKFLNLYIFIEIPQKKWRRWASFPPYSIQPYRLGLVVITFSQRTHTKDNCFEFLGWYRSEIITHLSLFDPPMNKQNCTQPFKLA